jgi:hypothetical protein
MGTVQLHNQGDEGWSNGFPASLARSAFPSPEMSWKPSVFRSDGVLANNSLFFHSQENPSFLESPGFCLSAGQVEQQVGESGRSENRNCQICENKV